MIDFWRGMGDPPKRQPFLEMAIDPAVADATYADPRAQHGSGGDNQGPYGLAENVLVPAIEVMADIPGIGWIIRKAAYNAASNQRMSSLDLRDVIRDVLKGPGGYKGGLGSADRVDPMGLFLGLSDAETAGFAPSEYRPVSESRHAGLPHYTIPDYRYVWSDSAGRYIHPDEATDGQVIAPPMSVDDDEARRQYDALLERISTLKEGDVISNVHPFAYAGLAYDSGKNTTSIGRDEHGTYLSLFDVWDFNNEGGERQYEDDYSFNEGRERTRLAAKMLDAVGDPFVIYDRFYFDPATGRYMPGKGDR